VSDAAKLREAPLEGGDLVAHDEVRVFAHPQNGIIDPRTQPAALRLEVH
jgi:hypothetical protein